MLIFIRSSAAFLPLKIELYKTMTYLIGRLILSMDDLKLKNQSQVENDLLKCDIWISMSWCHISVTIREGWRTPLTPLTLLTPVTAFTSVKTYGHFLWILMWLIYPRTATAVVTPAFVTPCQSPPSLSQWLVTSTHSTPQTSSCFLFKRQDREDHKKIWQASNGECKWKGQMLMLKAQWSRVITKHSSAFYLMPSLILEVPSQRAPECPPIVHLKGLFFIYQWRSITLIEVWWNQLSLSFADSFFSQLSARLIRS